jgi:hypothetical protein
MTAWTALPLTLTRAAAHSTAQKKRRFPRWRRWLASATISIVAKMNDCAVDDHRVSDRGHRAIASSDARR